LAGLFATTLEQMLEAELTAQLGYEKYEAKGRNSGNNRNGRYKRKVRSSGGEVELAVPREGCADVPFARRFIWPIATSLPSGPCHCPTGLKS
jgi:hypothetical protein